MGRVAGGVEVTDADQVAFADRAGEKLAGARPASSAARSVRQSHFRSRVWDDMRSPTRDSEEDSRGEVLEVNTEFLQSALTSLGLTLILQVSISRDTHRPYYQRREDNDEFDWLERSGKTYLIDPQGTGSNTDKALALGRMLVTHLDQQDTLGHWTSYHPAELITAAETPGTSVEQRRETIETILKLWTHRCYYPGSGPLADFSGVLTALDRLGDDRLWRFSPLPFDAPTTGPASSADAPRLVQTAAKLDQLCRESLIRLLWLAAHNAETEARDWLGVADELASNLESDATAMLRRLCLKLERYVERENASAEASRADPRHDTGNESSQGTDEAKEDSGELDPLSNLSHSRRLRDMAR